MKSSGISSRVCPVVLVVSSRPDETSDAPVASSTRGGRGGETFFAFPPPPGTPRPAPCRSRPVQCYTRLRACRGRSSSRFPKGQRAPSRGGSTNATTAFRPGSKFGPRSQYALARPPWSVCTNNTDRSAVSGGVAPNPPPPPEISNRTSSPSNGIPSSSATLTSTGSSRTSERTPVCPFPAWITILLRR